MSGQPIYNEPGYREAYDGDRYGGTFGRYLHDLEVEAFLSLMAETPGSVLDVGAGTGKLSLALLNRSCRVVSADASWEMLRIARRKAQRKGQVLRSVICDVQDLCFKEQALDCLVASRVLMHIGDWKSVIAELCRVARRIVIIDVPSLCSFGGLESLFRRPGTLGIAPTRTYRAFLAGRIARELHKN